MKKIIALLAIFVSILVFGCEKEITFNPDYLFNDVSIVVRLNDTLDCDVAIKVIEDSDGHYLYITNDTIIWKERISGSGFSSGSIRSIDIGNQIKYYYDMNDTDFQSNPVIIYVIELYVYL